MKRVILMVLMACIMASAASADGGDDDELPLAETPQKSGRLLPGEEVVTSSGKKVKVWSTEGPVAVAPAPQPFDDPESRRIPANTQLYLGDGSRTPLRDDSGSGARSSTNPQ